MPLLKVDMAFSLKIIDLQNKIFFFILPKLCFLLLLSIN